MTDCVSKSGDHAVKRRDFLFLTAGMFAGAGSVLAMWPFIDSLNPTGHVLALETVDVDLASIETGQAVTVVWQGKPVFVRRRSAEEIRIAEQTSLDELVDPQPDAGRVIKPEWIVLLGVCPHLGCVPQGQRATQSRGDWNGWHCRCHNSHYDVSGRVRKGPSPKNLPVPPYEFLNDATIRIG